MFDPQHRADQAPAQPQVTGEQAETDSTAAWAPSAWNRPGANESQDESAWGVGPMRLHPAWIALRAIESLRSMALPLIIVLVSRRSVAEIVTYVVLLGVLAVSVASRAIAWYRLSYEVTPQGVWHRSGLLQRRERFLPFERVQSVNLSENVLHRVFGVVRMTIESAAGGQREGDIVLDAIGRREAESLRLRIARTQRAVSAPNAAASGTATAVATAPVEAEGTLLRRVSPAELALAGAVSGSIGPLAALAGGVVQLADDLLPETIGERIAVSATSLTVQGIVALIVAIAAIAWVLSIAGTLVRYWGFELRESGDRLLLSYGLLDRRRVTVPRNRIQALTITEGLLAQPLGRGGLRFLSAGDWSSTSESGVLLPVIARREIERLLPRIHPRLAVEVASLPLERLPRRALSRYLLAPAWGVLLLTGVAVFVLGRWTGLTWQWGLLGLAVLPVAVAIGLAQFRTTGWWVGPGGELVVRSRPLERETMITLRGRLQFTQVASNPLQRRAALATFTSVVPGAGGRIAIQHLDAADADALARRLLPRPRPTAVAPSPSVADSALSARLPGADAGLRTGAAP
jgi:putative membrane protein